MTEENKDKINDLLQSIENAQANLLKAKTLIEGMGPDELREVAEKAREVGNIEQNKTQKIVEGVFNGQNMIGPEGEIYTVPANYASKSKLVEGDILKLTISKDGSFVYKQIGPVERSRVTGSLVRDDESGEFKAVAGSDSYKLILASVTYYKGEPGDKVVVLIPKEGGSKWAAVENIIKEGEEIPAELLENGADAELGLGMDFQLEDKEDD
ncbi:hypothetical protein KKC88_06215 [Patescibacteria group bacterium]|nr:hypothetical protein [Patescibacteria group bacterium]MBU1673923.1 hypothetical protein [Patescibacteria group bacterium]MBU1963917.1 hypothetical protein [Patescibacteria group bacterium]